MLLNYCELVVYIIFLISILGFAKRFFLIVDDIPFEQQRELSAREGGRIHPLVRRSYDEYRHAFDYAHFVMSRGRITRISELRYLQTYKNQVRNQSARQSIKTIIFKE